MKAEQKTVTNMASTLRVRTLTLAAIVAVGCSTGVAAAQSNPTEMRGFNSCVAAFEADNLSGVTMPRVYYISATSKSKTYYVNASAWRNGERVAQRITCETSRSGREVYSVQAADGRYVLNDSNGLVVAER